jgi:hypothetical protein
VLDDGARLAAGSEISVWTCSTGVTGLPDHDWLRWIVPWPSLAGAADTLIDRAYSIAHPPKSSTDR